MSQGEKPAESLAERLKSMTPLQRAVFALKETQARLEALQRKYTEPIAIVGVACRFPGGADNAQAYWRLLCEGVDAVGPIPPGRWDVERFYDPDPHATGKMNCRFGGFLERIEEFDNHFFGISDREALRLDPQQRILMELAWEALEDGGLRPSALRGSKTGVFLGISMSEYGMILASDLSQTDAHAAAGTALSTASNRLSFILGLNGPSMSLDTACSSSLVAVHLACQGIRNGDCDMALACGSNLLLSPIGTINLTKAGFCAADGKVRAFDAAASGYVRSEGAGVVVLKTLSAAQAAGDRVYAVIRGSAVNQNGSGNGLTAPNRLAQEQLLRDALARAGVSPGQIGYVETQGTGTRLGDAIEAQALGNVLGEGRPAGGRCAIGSVKTNLGHLEAAAGMASLLKVMLAVEHGQLPPSLHFKTPNPEIPFATLPLKVQDKLEPWSNGQGLRLAGVSAFGFGGSNAHVVVQQAPPPDGASQAVVALPGAASAAPRLLPLSARTEKALVETVRRFRQFLAGPQPAWDDICYTAAARRDHHDCRVAVLADDAQAALARLGELVSEKDQPLVAAAAAGNPLRLSRPGLFAGRKPFGRNLKLAFVHDGRPEPWIAFADCLAPALPGWAGLAAETDALLERVAGWRFSAMTAARWTDPAYAQPALVALQLTLTAWWRCMGVAPDVVLGRGLGELAAAATAGILTAEEALRLALPASQNAAAGVEPKAARLPFISAADGRPHRGPDLDAGYWRSRSRPGKEALPAAAAELSARQVDFCLELGPESLAADWPAAADPPPSPARLASLAAVAGSVDALTAVGTLYAAGADVDWSRLAPPGGRCVRLPTYPWQRRPFWAPDGKWLGKAPASATPTATPAPATSPVAAPAAPSPLPDAASVQPRPDLTTPYVAPRTALETQLAQAWSEVLRVEPVGIHDNFFELGGDSLQAMILLNRLQEQSLREMFLAPTIAALAARIEEAQADGRSGRAAIPVAPRDGQLLPSFTQEALWFLDQLERDQATYTIYSPLRIRGPLKVDLARRALNEIARRHEILRTTFPEVEGRPVQRIDPYAQRPLPLIDFSHLPPAARELEMRQWIFDEMGRPIDLQRGPLIRVTMLRLADDDHVAVVSTHHIIYDGWSMGLLIRELTTLYTAFALGQPSPLRELSIQYADFAAWQRSYLQGETLARLRGYWVEQLSGVSPLELPTDHPRPAIRTTRGATRAFRFSPELSAALLEFCRHEGSTPFMVLLSALEVLLGRYSGQDDFAIGSPVANRNQPETEALIGYFVNVVVLRSRLGGDPSFREVIARVKQTALDAFDHQEMTLDQVVEAVNPPRDMSRHPLFQVMFALQNIELPTQNPFGIDIGAVEDGPLARSAFFDLTLAIWQAGAVFSAELNYRTDLFTDDTIARMVEHLEVLLAGAMRRPDEPVSNLPWLGADEQRRVVDQWNATAAAYPRDKCLHQQFADQARRDPAAVAVVSGDRRCTYGQIDEQSNRLARYLQSRGVGPETRVGICLERSPELIVAILGVLKAGGAYVPLDPAYNSAAAERARYVLDNSQAALVVTAAALAQPIALDRGRLIVLDGDAAVAIAAMDDTPPPPAAEAHNLAYILYTSGSTGRPKGVMVTHGNLLNAGFGWQTAYRLGNEVRTHLQMASFGFDVFAGDLVRALGSGGKLVLCPKEILLDPPALLDLLRREAVDMAEFVPVVLRSLVEHLEATNQKLDFMRLVVVGSDVWHVADHKRAGQVLGPDVRLVNSYGLTETTIDSTYFEGQVRALPDAAMVPIGRPFPNVRLYILDQKMHPVPIGVPGELYIGGDGVSRGYVDAELNEGRFVGDPFSAGATLCKTGDRAGWRLDGSVEFLGRVDNQVKIRGFRIEPGEVEQVLEEHPSVAKAVVVARERTAGDLRLVAYVITRDAAGPDGFGLRQFLTKRVPEYMIPSAFVGVSALPVNASGKVDRRALPEPDWSQAAGQGEYVAPSTPTEEELAMIWADVLQLERVGTHDDFFALGGHSLLALRVMARIRESFAADVPLVQLFLAPTVASLAEVVDKIRSGVDPATLLGGQGMNWEAECDLDPAVRVTDSLQPAAAPPQRILLTGATGFLGAFLLRELLQQTTAEIHCLVRARSADDARAKLVRNLRQYGLGSVGPLERVVAGGDARVVPVCGDFSEPRLGLTPDKFAELSESIDAIYHNGAQVSPFYTYGMLKPANVLGTVEILRLATLVRVKPVHFVSTISVYESPEYQLKPLLDEDTPLEHFATLTSGYAQTKTVAERLVRAAGARGLPVVVYRPGRITADSASGAAATSDQTALILRLCIELGAAPESETEVDLTPVDYVARSIVTLSNSPDSLGRTFHLSNPQPVAVAGVYQAIRAAGYELNEVPFAAWRKHVIEAGSGSSNEMLAALAHALVVDVPAETATAETEEATQAAENGAVPQAGQDVQAPVAIQCRKTVEALKPLKINCPVVDARSLVQYLMFLKAQGVLPSPETQVPSPEPRTPNPEPLLP